jgi:hypothetical protein
MQLRCIKEHASRVPPWDNPLRHTSFGLLLMHKLAYGFRFGEATAERNSRNCARDFFLGLLECWLIWRLGREILRSVPFVEKKRELGLDDCWGGGTRARH